MNIRKCIRIKEIKSEYLDDETWEDILLTMKDAMYKLEDVGWCKGSFVAYANSGGTEQAYCAVGSIMAAVAAREGAERTDNYRSHSVVTGINQMLDVVVHDRFLAQRWDGIVSFNDWGGSNLEDILDVFRATCELVQEVMFDV
jgi:hypothetical protein